MAKSPTIGAVLAVATDVARRRHHAVVRASHVLVALFEAPGMDGRVRRRGFDADHLREAAERALDDLPAITGYRDAVPPVVCPSVERAFEHADMPVIAYGAHEIVPALEGAPELRGAFRPYVLDESLVDRLRSDAPGRDIADAMTLLLAEHLDLAERLIDGGLDTTDLTTRSGRAFRDVLPDVVEASRAAGLRAVEPALLLAFLTREIAYASGYELPLIGDAIELLLHGPRPADEVGDAEPAELVFVNDPITPAATVQGILTGHFGLSELEAYGVTMAIDARDQAVVARLAGAPARELGAIARRFARRDGYPLRVLVTGRA